MACQPARLGHDAVGVLESLDVATGEHGVHMQDVTFIVITLHGCIELLGVHGVVCPTLASGSC